MTQYTFNFEEPDRRCAYCGKYDECKPFGLHKEYICYGCARKDARLIKKILTEELFRENVFIV